MVLSIKSCLQAVFHILTVVGKNILLSLYYRPAGSVFSMPSPAEQIIKLVLLKYETKKTWLKLSLRFDETQRLKICVSFLLIELRLKHIRSCLISRIRFKHVISRIVEIKNVLPSCRGMPEILLEN